MKLKKLIKIAGTPDVSKRKPFEFELHVAGSLG